MMLLQIGVFLVDNVIGKSTFVKRYLYLWSKATYRFQFWQPFTSLFCHRDKLHLGGNLFLLLLMGRSVEAQHGAKGLWTSFAICGIASGLVSLLVFPGRTISAGAAGGILGLFLLPTLGIGALLLALFERMQGMRIIDMLAVFGGAPMFFYLLHLSVLRILYHSALAIWGWIELSFLSAHRNRLINHL